MQTHIGAFGAEIVVCGPSEAVVEAVSGAATERTVLSRLAAGSSAPTHCRIVDANGGLVAELWHDGEPVHRLPPAGDLGQLCDYVVGSIHRLVAVASEGYSFIHAGCVEIDGTLVIVPARSKSGKSTLVHDLVGLGATYWSDEFVAIDPLGTLHPYHKPISMRDGHRRPLLVDVAPAAPDASSLSAPCLVVHTSYRSGAASHHELRSMSRSDIALALLDNSVTARRRPGPDIEAVASIAERSHGWSGERGESADVARWLMAVPQPGPQGHPDHAID